MFFLPFETHVILTDLSKTEVLERIARSTMNVYQFKIEANNRAFKFLGEKYSKPFVGHVEVTGNFELEKLSNYSTLAPPQIYGNVITKGEKTMIVVKFRPNYFSWFFTLCFLLSLYAFIRTIYTSWPENVINSGTIISSMLLLASYLFIMIPHKISVHFLKKYLTSMVQI